MAYVPSKKKLETENAARALSTLRERLKSGELSGVYVFRGEEEYTKRYYFGEMKKAAGKGASSSGNITEFYGDEFSFPDFYDAVMTAPGLDYAGSFFDDEPQNEKTVRIVRAFDPKLTGLSAKEEETLLSLCKTPPKGVAAVFWFSYSSPDGEKKFEKGLPKKLRDAALDISFMHEPPGSVKLRKWAQKHVSAAGCYMDDRTADFFLSSVGNDMSTLDHELQKLCAYKALRENKTVDFDDISAVCIRTEEAKLEELTDAALRGDFGKAQTALSLLLREKTSETYILGAIAGRVAQLYGVYTYRALGLSNADIAAKLGIWESRVRTLVASLSAIGAAQNPARLTEWAALCAEYDKKLKSSPCDKGILLTDLLFRAAARSVCRPCGERLP